MAATSDLLLPGFRFFPTDEELVAYYLRRKAFRGLSHDHVIGELDLYNFEPWDLPGLAVLKSRDGQWFFFAPRERRQPGNTRNSRATKLGYWKTTGKDRKVPHGSETPMGLKKTLVYYQGRAPRGTRTDWVMHEYRIAGEYERAQSVDRSAFVVCKVFKKGGPGPRNGEQYGAPVHAGAETEIKEEAEEEEEEEEDDEEEGEGEFEEAASKAPCLPAMTIPSMAAIKQEEEELLAFLARPATSRLILPSPSPDVVTKTISDNSHFPEENPWSDPAKAKADELFADLPCLANDVLFSAPSDRHTWASSSGGGGEEEGSVLAEMLQTAKLAEASALRKEGGEGNETPDLPFYYNYYCPTPPPPDFTEVEDLMAMHHRDAPTFAESTMMVKCADQYSFHQPPIAPSEGRPSCHSSETVAESTTVSRSNSQDCDNANKGSISFYFSCTGASTHANDVCRQRLAFDSDSRGGWCIKLSSDWDMSLYLLNPKR